MLRRRFAVLVAVVVSTVGFGSPSPSRADHGCAIASGFGNAGYAAGYSTMVTRWGWRGGGCGPRIGGWCARPPLVCPPRPCAPAWGWGGGWSCGPRWGCWPGRAYGGWCGSTTVIGRDAFWLNAPCGGGFFFGGAAAAPWFGFPANWLPGCGLTPWGVGWTPYAVMLPAGVGPQFGPAGVLPFLGAAANPAPRTAVAAAHRQVERPRLARGANPLMRRRAAKLLALGDEHLRAAAVDPARLTAALESYRRAAAFVPDDADTFVREALALEALGRQEQAAEALDRAVAVDGRLASAPAAVAAGRPVDPVFGDRPTGEPAPLAARGLAILRLIGDQGEAADASAEALARLADRWSARWAGEAKAVAAR